MQTLRIALIGIATALAVGYAVPAGAGTQSAGFTEIPGIVRRALPAVVSITTRRFEQDQFNDRTMRDLHGAVEVVWDPYGGPDPLVCSGITIQGACLER
jgi:hypothetical protein